MNSLNKIKLIPLYRIKQIVGLIEQGNVRLDRQLPFQ